MFYLIWAFVFLIVYIIAIFLMKYMKNNSYINKIIPCFMFLAIIVESVYYFILDGSSSYNFRNTLPVANVSPFMFINGIIIIFFPNKIKKYGNTLICLLSLGMFIAGIGLLLNTHFCKIEPHWNFLLNAFNHILFSLFGIYLYKTNQVHQEKKKIVYSASIIVVVALFMLVLNAFFQTSYFGLSLYGNHNIYNLVLCQDSILSAIIYFIGLSLVLISGWKYSKIINKKNENV